MLNKVKAFPKLAMKEVMGLTGGLNYFSTKSPGHYLLLRIRLGIL
jgi:hypothetical protein